MHEIEKIEEAEYFYAQMCITKEDPDTFRYNLSAFLSAARSVLQFIINKVRSNPKSQQWYDSSVATNRIISFFKDKRDINIHIKPVGVRKDVHIEMEETLAISTSFSITAKDERGNVTAESKSEPELSKAKNRVAPKITYRYRFEDWPGEEDILTLCQMYLSELKFVVSEGLAKGFLS